MAPPQSLQATPAHGRNDDARLQVILASTPCMVLALAALTMRLVSRRIKRSRLVIPDYLAIGGLVSCLTAYILLMWAAHCGLGLHIYSVSLDNVRIILINLFVGEVIYGISFTLVKLSIITLYRQLFPTRFMLLSTTILAVIVVMWGFSVVLVSLLSCIPARCFWDSVFPDYNIPTKCIDTKWFFIAISLANILTDVLLLGLPMRDTWRLRIPPLTKIAISGLFALGAFVIVASSFRVYNMLVQDLGDLTWSVATWGIWSAIELQVAVISSCLPMIKPALIWLAPKSFKQKFTSDPNPANRFNPVINSFHRYKFRSSHIQNGQGNQLTACSVESDFDYWHTNQTGETIVE